MSMGGPADHWYTDIFSWNRYAFGEQLSRLAADLVPIRDDLRAEAKLRGWEVE